LGAIKPKDLNRIAKIGYGHLWLREENKMQINGNKIPNSISDTSGIFLQSCMVIRPVVDNTSITFTFISSVSILIVGESE